MTKETLKSNVRKRLAATWLQYMAALQEGRKRLGQRQLPDCQRRAAALGRVHGLLHGQAQRGHRDPGK